MPDGNITHGVTGAETMGWSVTVKPAIGQTIKAFWLVHSGNGVNTQTFNNPMPIPQGGVTLPGLLQSTGSRDGWTIIYMDSGNNLWCNNDWLEGSSSGKYDLPNGTGYTNCALTITPGAPNSSGVATVNISWTFTNNDGLQQSGQLNSPLPGFVNINTLD